VPLRVMATVTVWEAAEALTAVVPGNRKTVCAEAVAVTPEAKAKTVSRSRKTWAQRDRDRDMKVLSAERSEAARDIAVSSEILRGVKDAGRAEAGAGREDAGLTRDMDLGDLLPLKVSNFGNRKVPGA
jgi:hypothetical protein